MYQNGLRKKCCFPRGCVYNVLAGMCVCVIKGTVLGVLGSSPPEPLLCSYSVQILFYASLLINVKNNCIYSDFSLGCTVKKLKLYHYVQISL